MSNTYNCIDVVSVNKKLTTPSYQRGHIIETGFIDITLDDFKTIFYQREMFSINKNLSSYASQDLLDLITFDKQTKKVDNLGNALMFEITGNVTNNNPYIDNSTGNITFQNLSSDDITNSNFVDGEVYILNYQTSSLTPIETGNIRYVGNTEYEFQNIDPSGASNPSGNIGIVNDDKVWVVSNADHVLSNMNLKNEILTCYESDTQCPREQWNICSKMRIEKSLIKTRTLFDVYKNNCGTSNDDTCFLTKSELDYLISQNTTTARNVLRVSANFKSCNPNIQDCIIMFNYAIKGNYPSLPVSAQRINFKYIYNFTINADLKLNTTSNDAVPSAWSTLFSNSGHTADCIKGDELLTSFYVRGDQSPAFGSSNNNTNYQTKTIIVQDSLVASKQVKFYFSSTDTAAYPTIIIRQKNITDSDDTHQQTIDDIEDACPDNKLLFHLNGRDYELLWNCLSGVVFKPIQYV